MRKFFVKFLIVILIIFSFYVSAVLIKPWKINIADQTVNIPILYKGEIIILESEKDIPSEESLIKQNKEKLYVGYKRDFLNIYLFNPKILKKIFCQKMEISPYTNLQNNRLITEPIIKKVVRDNNFLKIIVGIDKKEEKTQRYLLCIAIGTCMMLLFFALYILICSIKTIIKDKKNKNKNKETLV